MSVELHCNGRIATAQPGQTLFDCAEALGIRVPTSCRKQGKCKECLVEIASGAEFLSPRTPAEAHLKDRFRLSCCCTVAADAGVVRCHTLRRGELRIERHALQLPGSGRQPQFDPTVTRDGDRIRLDGVEVTRAGGPIHGLAMDLGTTTVVLRLLNLETGEIVADASFENPQRFGGSDVMARIHYDTEDRTKLLQRTLAGYISHAIEEFPVDPKSIYEMVIVGNSAMRDLFFRLSVYSIGQHPFQSVSEIELAAGRRASTSLSEVSPRLGLPLHPQARVYGLPIISGHVGADAAACMLAVDLAHEDRLVAIMDIGTNTELILGNRHKILAASCPAGPAFEGGRISCGMPGLPGAIERVTRNADGSWRLGVIGESPAQGLCGSGLIDLLGELVEHGGMTSRGRFTSGERQVVLTAPGAEPVIFTPGDASELAQAKGANVAGLRVVFDRFGARFDDVEVFYLAGGFGRHLNVTAAKRIGLIPDLADAKILQVGNAAIEGACLALVSRARRAELEQLVRRVTHCQLETHPHFFDYFVDGCQFHPIRNSDPVPNVAP
jgi:uncharacterized 2Fe-2S/4Fe-4S cluster protein (DUF4445 family)